MDFQRPDPEQQKLWEQSSLMYADQMEEGCLSYLNGRGINMESVNRFRLGYVTEPIRGHEAYRGRLCIPYVKKLATVALKFRCIQDHSCKEAKHPKYLNEGNQWLYNTEALTRGGECDICEGELDTIIIEQMGRNAVGIPGVDAWKGHPHWRDLLRPPLRGLVWVDNDSSKQQNYGLQLGKRITSDLPRYRTVLPPEDHDVSSTYTHYGPEKLLACAGLPSEALMAA